MRMLSSAHFPSLHHSLILTLHPPLPPFSSLPVSYAAGVVGSLVYVRMLSSSVEAVGANSVEGAVR